MWATRTASREPGQPNRKSRSPCGEPSQAGAASGVLTTTQQFASAAGVAILGSIFFAFLGSGRDVEAYAKSTERYAYLALICVLIAAGLAALIHRRRPGAQVGKPQSQRV